jgi:integrase/recombinase XerD
VVGLRDRAIVAILIYTAARIGAVAELRHKDFEHYDSQYTLRFAEKDGKAREIRVRQELEGYILAWLDAAGQQNTPGDSPLFRTTVRRTKQFTDRGMSTGDMGRVVKRRLKDARLPPRLSPNLFRVTAITDLLSQGIPLEDAQQLAGHADPQTTRLYDRRQKKVTRNVMEQISV